MGEIASITCDLAFKKRHAGKISLEIGEAQVVKTLEIRCLNVVKKKSGVQSSVELHAQVADFFFFFFFFRLC